MKWKKMKRLLDDFVVTPEFIIHSELNSICKENNP